MNQVKAGTEFLNMGEEEILAALDRFEEAEAEKDEHLQDGEPEDPVVREVGRLIRLLRQLGGNSRHRLYL